jgi:hypothetical protein
VTSDQYLLLGGAFVLLLGVAVLLERVSPRRAKHRRGRADPPPERGEIID